LPGCGGSCSICSAASGGGGEAGDSAPCKYDGTVTVHRGDSEGELAVTAAHCRKTLGKKAVSLALVAGAGARTRLNAAYRELDLPRLPERCAVASSPLIQLVPLALRLHWAPFDPQAWLEFLLHPAGPLPRRFRFRLARAIDEMPGRGNEEWTRAVGKELDESGEDPGGREKLQKAIDCWLNLETFDPEGGAPGAVLGGTVKALAGWMASVGAARAGDDPEGSGGAWLAAAAMARRFSELLGRRSAAISRRELEHTLGIWLEQAGELATPGELGAPFDASRPDHVLEPAGHLHWWLPADARIDRIPWTRKEMDWLRSHGGEPVPKEIQLSEAERADRRAILLAKKSVTFFVCPGARRGGASSPPGILVRVLAELGEARVPPAKSPVKTVKLPLKPLPGPRRWWHLEDPLLLAGRDRESFSSLSKCIYSPYQWVLQYLARLEPGRLVEFRVRDDARRRGTLLHILAGRILAPPSDAAAPPPDWRETDDSALRAWIAGQWENLLGEYAAHLLSRDMSAARAELLHLAQASIPALAGHLREAGVERIEMEREIRDVPFGSGSLGGYLDMVVRAGKATAVVDLKLGGRTVRENELRENRHLQLAAYAKLLKSDEKTDAATAFYILGNSVLLARSKDFFPGASVPGRRGGGDDSEWSGCWKEFGEIWRWRMEQFAEGRIEVTTGDTKPDETPPLEHWAAPKDADRFNIFDALVGWPQSA